MSVDGILLIDKPEGWTSHDVVAKVRGRLKSQTGVKVKVGHTGTLDPLATGLLILTVGKACKRAGEFSKLDKTYEVGMKLGETSSTGDSEGEISDFSWTAPGNVKVKQRRPDEKEVSLVVNSFVGEVEQVPPKFSAIKVNGQRAYKLARQGKEVKLQPRNVTIYDISQIIYKYPNISFMVSVSSGTYIRSLAVDIGQKLNTGAYMTSLRRLTVGTFKLANSYPLQEVTLDSISHD